MKIVLKIIGLLIVLTFVFIQVGSYAADKDEIAKITKKPKIRPYLPEKLKELQSDVKTWIDAGNNPTEVAPLMKKLKNFLDAKKFYEIEKLIDKIGAIIKSDNQKQEDEEAKEQEGEPIEEPIISGDYEKIKVIGGAVNNGRGDPSLEYGHDGTGWLTYTSVDVKNSVLITHLAKSNDNGKTWEFVKVINKPSSAVIEGYKGAFVHETTTLVYDPDDSGKEWKVFWFEYFRSKEIADEGRLYTKSWIAYKYASDPEGEWSEEIPVLGMGDYRDKGTDLASLHPDLEDFVFAYELGSIYLDGVIYLSVEGSVTLSGKGEWKKRKIFLLSSNNHGKTWKYVDTLINYNDAKNTGYFTYTASSLFKENNRIFLLASPSGKLSDPRDEEGHHDGADIFEFEDITKAKLKRDNKGKLILIKHIDDNLIKGGQGDYDEKNTYGGILIPQQDTKYYPEVFQIFSTKERIID